MKSPFHQDPRISGDYGKSDPSKGSSPALDRQGSHCESQSRWHRQVVPCSFAHRVLHQKSSGVAPANFELTCVSVVVLQITILQLKRLRVLSSENCWNHVRRHISHSSWQSIDGKMSCSYMTGSKSCVSSPSINLVDLCKNFETELCWICRRCFVWHSRAFHVGDRRSHWQWDLQSVGTMG